MANFNHESESIWDAIGVDKESASEHITNFISQQAVLAATQPVKLSEFMESMQNALTVDEIAVIAANNLMAEVAEAALASGAKCQCSECRARREREEEN